MPLSFLIDSTMFHLFLAPVEVCRFEEFASRCPNNKIIIMEKSFYGRMQVGRCISSKLGHLGCAGDALKIFDDLCSGQRSCHLEIPDKILDGVDNCDPEVTKYLEASYQCIQGKPLPLSLLDIPFTFTCT